MSVPPLLAPGCAARAGLFASSGAGRFADEVAALLVPLAILTVSMRRRSTSLTYSR